MFFEDGGVLRKREVFGLRPRRTKNSPTLHLRSSEPEDRREYVEGRSRSSDRLSRWNTALKIQTSGKPRACGEGWPKGDRKKKKMSGLFVLPVEKMKDGRVLRSSGPECRRWRSYSVFGAGKSKNSHLRKEHLGRSRTSRLPSDLRTILRSRRSNMGVLRSSAKDRRLKMDGSSFFGSADGR